MISSSEICLPFLPDRPHKSKYARFEAHVARDGHLIWDWSPLPAVHVVTYIVIIAESTCYNPKKRGFSPHF